MFAKFMSEICYCKIKYHEETCANLRRYLSVCVKLTVPGPAWDLRPKPFHSERPISTEPYIVCDYKIADIF